MNELRRIRTIAIIFPMLDHTIENPRVHIALTDDKGSQYQGHQIFTLDDIAGLEEAVLEAIVLARDGYKSAARRAREELLQNVANLTIQARES